jgi:hypothetical protein
VRDADAKADLVPETAPSRRQSADSLAQFKSHEHGGASCTDITSMMAKTAGINAAISMHANAIFCLISCLRYRR